MAITYNNVQNVKFLRNSTPAVSREAAKTAMEAQLANLADGTAILGRYTDASGTVKTLVGIVYVSGSTSSLTIFDIDGASADVEALRQEINAKLGEGVTSANTATDQLEALSGSTADTSATTSVEGAKRYADDLISGLDYTDTAVTGSYVSKVDEANGVISVTREALPTVGAISEAGKPITAVSESLGEISATAGTINAEFVNYAGTTGHTGTTVEDALDYIYETIDNFEDYTDTPVEGKYVSSVGFVDGTPQITREALPSASTVSGESKVVIDVTQDKGAITATAANLTGVKLDGYVADTGATGDVASSDTLGQALAKLQTQVNATESAIEGLDYTGVTTGAGVYVTNVTEENGVVSATTATLPTVAAISEAGKPITAVSESLGEVSATAGTINAEYVNVADGGDVFTATTVEGVLAEIDAAYKAADEAIVGDATTSGDTLGKLEDRIDSLEDDAKEYHIVKTTTGLPADIKERYSLVDADGNVSGDTVDIPKDSHIVSITYDGTTQKLTYTYINASGETASTDVDMSELVLETEFGSGVTVTDHVAHGVVDPTSESFLTVGADGFKLSGVQDAIDTAISGLDFTTDAAVAGQYVAAIEETDGVVAVKTRANVSEAVLNNYAKGSDATAVAATDTVNQAISKLENQVDAVDGLVDALSAKTFTVATSSNASITTATTTAADGTVSVDLITDADKIKMSGFTNATSLSAITTDDSIATAFEKAASAIDAAKSASTTEVVEGTDAGNNMTITPATSQTDGHVTYTISLTDVASDSALTTEIAARKAVDGQNGDTYAANSSANYISDATSLNDADVKLDTQVKANADAIAENKVVAGNGIEVGTPASTGTSVSVKIDDTTYPGGSALAADTNGLRITSIDCGTY